VTLRPAGRASNNATPIGFHLWISNMHLITLTQNLVNIKAELNLIGANARGLRGPGRELLPLKEDMLMGLPPVERAAVLEAVELLFAAVLQFVDAQIREQQAIDAVGVVAARIDKGQADGTVTALVRGSTRDLFIVACEQAPIAMHAIIETSPELAIRQRLSGEYFRRPVPAAIKAAQRRARKDR
jgi:hypothetical protein